METFVVVRDAYGDQHAAKLLGRSVVACAVEIRDALGLGDDRRLDVGTCQADCAGAARLRAETRDGGKDGGIYWHGWLYKDATTLRDDSLCAALVGIIETALVCDDAAWFQAIKDANSCTPIDTALDALARAMGEDPSVWRKNTVTGNGARGLLARAKGVCIE